MVAGKETVELLKQMEGQTLGMLAVQSNGELEKLVDSMAL